MVHRSTLLLVGSLVAVLTVAGVIFWEAFRQARPISAAVTVPTPPASAAPKAAAPAPAAEPARDAPQPARASAPAQAAAPAPSAAPVPTQAAAPTAPAPAPTATPAAAPPAPSFDVVRVSPRGEAVIAGRAAPGAEVVVKDGAVELGKTRADARGEWVVVPEKQLAAGSRSLSLEARAEPQAQPQKSAADVVLVVPERDKDVAGRAVEKPAAPLALLVPREGTAPARPLQLPGGAAPKDRLGVDVVEYTAQGEVAIGGAAEPGKHVRVYLGEQLIAQSKAESDGRWSAQPEAPVAPGTYTLRVEQMTNDGTVAARVSLPFQRAAIAPGGTSDRAIVVQPGDNLWYIARHTYGSGFRYAVIYEANRAHIANPDLIYPGQVFALPAAN